MSTLTKKFLYALEAKGADICDDVTILANGDGNYDLYLGEGTAATSFVKEVEFVEHDFGVDEEGNPIHGTGPVHALKLTRGFGDIVYKPLKGINDLLSLDVAGEISNLSEVAANIALIQSEVTAAMQAQTTARLLDVQNLESSFDTFIADIHGTLMMLSDSLYQHVDAKDAWVLKQKEDLLDQIAVDAMGILGRDYKHATISFSQLTSTNTVEILLASGDAERINPDRWIIRAHRKDTSDVLHNDSVAHVITANPSESKLTVSLQAAACGDGMFDGDEIHVTAVYCGPLDHSGVDQPGNVVVDSEPAYGYTRVGTAALDDSDEEPGYVDGEWRGYKYDPAEEGEEPVGGEE